MRFLSKPRMRRGSGGWWREVRLRVAIAVPAAMAASAPPGSPACPEPLVFPSGPTRQSRSQESLTLPTYRATECDSTRRSQSPPPPSWVRVEKKKKLQRKKHPVEATHQGHTTLHKTSSRSSLSPTSPTSIINVSRGNAEKQASQRAHSPKRSYSTKQKTSSVTTESSPSAPTENRGASHKRKSPHRSGIASRPNSPGGGGAGRDRSSGARASSQTSKPTASQPTRVSRKFSRVAVALGRRASRSLSSSTGLSSNGSPGSKTSRGLEPQDQERKSRRLPSPEHVGVGSVPSKKDLAFVGRRYMENLRKYGNRASFDEFKLDGECVLIRRVPDGGRIFMEKLLPLLEDTSVTLADFTVRHYNASGVVRTLSLGASRWGVVRALEKACSSGSSPSTVVRGVLHTDTTETAEDLRGYVGKPSRLLEILHGNDVVFSRFEEDWGFFYPGYGPDFLRKEDRKKVSAIRNTIKSDGQIERQRLTPKEACSLIEEALFRRQILSKPVIQQILQVELADLTDEERGCYEEQFHRFHSPVSEIEGCRGPLTMPSSNGSGGPKGRLRDCSYQNKLRDMIAPIIYSSSSGQYSAPNDCTSKKARTAVEAFYKRQLEERGEKASYVTIALGGKTELIFRMPDPGCVLSSGIRRLQSSETCHPGTLNQIDAQPVIRKLLRAQTLASMKSRWTDKTYVVGEGAEEMAARAGYANHPKDLSQPLPYTILNIDDARLYIHLLDDPGCLFSSKLEEEVSRPGFDPVRLDGTLHTPTWSKRLSDTEAWLLVKEALRLRRSLTPEQAYPLVKFYLDSSVPGRKHLKCMLGWMWPKFGLEKVAGGTGCNIPKTEENYPTFASSRLPVRASALGAGLRRCREHILQ